MSDQEPAPPGTAARCEICGRESCDRLFDVDARSDDLIHWRFGYEHLKAENAGLRARVAQLVGDLRAAEQERNEMRTSREVACDTADEERRQRVAAEHRAVRAEEALRGLLGEVQHEHCGACDEYFIEQHGAVDEGCAGLHYATAQADAALRAAGRGDEEAGNDK